MTPPRDAALDVDATAASFRVGAWLADPATNELRRDADVVRIEPKAMNVLVILARRAGQVVTRETLMACAWPGVIVGDEALTQSIIKLRRALGDSPRRPAYIETIAKRGYRLIASVGTATPDGWPARVETPGRLPAPRRLRPPAVAAGVVALLTLATVVLLRVHGSGQDPGAATEIPDLLPRAELTLTVVPFEALGAGDHAYLARGITNDLVTELARVPGLRLVTASVPAASPAGSRTSRYYVSGTVQRAGETLRINVHAVDGESGEPLWTERFERPYGDLFAMQDEIIGRVATLLPGKLADAARMRTARRYTRSLAAYDDFMQAQALFLTRRLPANEEARTLYRKALAADPNFARAYAGIAMTHALDHVLDPSPASEAALARALDLAQTARMIDPDLAEVHWALGFVHTQSRRLDDAAASLAQAIRINPSFADAYALLQG